MLTSVPCVPSPFPPAPSCLQWLLCIKKDKMPAKYLAYLTGAARPHSPEADASLGIFAAAWSLGGLACTVDHLNTMLVRPALSCLLLGAGAMWRLACPLSLLLSGRYF